MQACPKKKHAGVGPALLSQKKTCRGLVVQACPKKKHAGGGPAALSQKKTCRGSDTFCPVLNGLVFILEKTYFYKS